MEGLPVGLQIVVRSERREKGHGIDQEDIKKDVHVHAPLRSHADHIRKSTESGKVVDIWRRKEILGEVKSLADIAVFHLRRHHQKVVSTLSPHLVHLLVQMMMC